jgi:hypothetical protein
MPRLGPVSKHLAAVETMTLRTFVLGIALLVGIPIWFANRSATAGDIHIIQSEPTTSDAARNDAIRALPLEKLDAAAKAKVELVVANISIFRRMPISTIECDPDLYLFLSRHPDVVVNIWEIMKVSRLQILQTAPLQFQVTESGGTAANIEILFSDRDTQLVYGEGTYHGSLFAKAVQGRGLLLMKSGYARDKIGRCFVTSRLDSFISVESGGAEFLTKTIQPIIGKTADNNFTQTVKFVSSLSQTISQNSRGVQRLATHLDHVPPEVRNQFATLAGQMGQRNSSTANAEKPAAREAASQSFEVADRESDTAAR